MGYMDLYRHGFTGKFAELEYAARKYKSHRRKCLGGIKNKLVRSIFLNALYR